MRKVNVKGDIVSVQTESLFLMTDFKKNALRMSYENKAQNKTLKSQNCRCYFCDWPFQLSGSGELISIIELSGNSETMVCEDCFNNAQDEFNRTK